MPVTDSTAMVSNAILNLSLFGIKVDTLSVIALTIIMLTMGLTLELSHFRRLVSDFRPVLIGLIGQLIILPAMAFLIGYTFSVPPHVALGLVILACCPSAATSNFFSFLARGDVALSIMLTSISGLVVVFTIPLLINTASQLFVGETQAVHLPVMSSMMRIFSLVILPVSAGMLFKHVAPHLSLRIQPFATRSSFVLLLGMMVILLTAIFDSIPELLVTVGPVTVLLNISMMTFGFIGSRLLKQGEQQSRTICIEIGVQNFVLAIVISVAMLKRPEFSIVPTIYLFTMYLTVFPFIGYCRWIRDGQASNITLNSPNNS